jgi:hypothetical protein
MATEVNKGKKYTMSDRSPLLKKVTTQEKTQLQGIFSQIITAIKDKHLNN